MKSIIDDLSVLDVDISIDRSADIFLILSDTITSDLALKASKSNHIITPNPILAGHVSKQLSKHNIQKPIYAYELPATPADNVVDGHGIFLLGHGTHSAYNQLLRESVVSSRSRKEAKKELGITSDAWSYDQKQLPIYTCISLNKSWHCHEIKKFGLSGIPTISDTDTIKSQYIKNHITGFTLRDFRGHNLRELKDDLKRISSTTKQYYENICANPKERLKMIIDGNSVDYTNNEQAADVVDDNAIYLSPNEIPRIKKTYYKARTIAEALEKLSRLNFSTAYIIGLDEPISHNEKSELSKAVRRLGQKANRIRICHDIAMPYKWGIQVIPASYGIQLLS